MCAYLVTSQKSADSKMPFILFTTTPEYSTDLDEFHKRRICARFCVSFRPICVRDVRKPCWALTAIDT
jgi:hypothetical protein